MVELASETDIAIIGMAGRFPGAQTIEEFWRNVSEGVESITFYTDEQLRAAGVSEELLRNANYVKASSPLEGVELFDAPFFGYSPREAQLMDPQHRLFLEACWTALEHAGYNTETYDGLIGVFGGCAQNSYALQNVASQRDLITQVGTFQTMLGNEKDFLTTRVSYKLNLQGPSLTIQTACSTSLVAIHIACQSLLSGECDMALAGGVAVHIEEQTGYLYQSEGIASPDGHCRAFDANAQGTISGSGVGVIVLKRLTDALEDRDSIHAVVKGSAINNDGNRKIGYTAPSVDGQAEVISEAIKMAGVDPETIGYLEAHGTATNLGDPIEIMGLTRAFAQETEKKNFCPVGSVKTNIGHLDAAAGVAGLIKVVEALKYRQIPPSLHFERPNPKIDFENSPFYVNTTLQNWEKRDWPRRAGVSSFGIGGTNAHVILEEAPAPEPSRSQHSWHTLLLSAKTETALETATRNLHNYLKEHPEAEISDIAYTLQVGRKEFPFRRALLCSDTQDALRTLEQRDSRRMITATAAKRPIIFLFPGQGTQYPNMAGELYRTEAVFRQEIDRCAQLLHPCLELDIRSLLYPAEESRATVQEQLKQTQFTQPVLFVVEYALARLWMHWGIQPQAMIGHSIGEYVAACLAGVFSLEEALTLVATRGQLIQQVPSGAMLAVPLPEKEVCAKMGNDLSLAAVNTPALCVVAGPHQSIKDFRERLQQDHINTSLLQTSHAFHSHMMEPVKEPFAAFLRNLQLSAPKIPFVSNLTGTWITSEQATDPSYWTQHLRQTVRFAEGIETCAQEDVHFLEVGPGQSLTTLVRQANIPQRRVTRSLPHAKEERSDAMVMTQAIGELWSTGSQFDWLHFYEQEKRYRLPLPTYPFEGQRHWIEISNEQEIQAPEQLVARVARRSEWFYLPCWKQAPPLRVRSQQGTSCDVVLLFLNNQEFDEQFVSFLRDRFETIITVRIGTAFTSQGTAYTLSPQQSADYSALIEDLFRQGKRPTRVIHLWGMASPGQASALEKYEWVREHTFNSLLFLAQALHSQNVSETIKLLVITNAALGVLGNEQQSPEQALVTGICRVLTQEYSTLQCKQVDIVPPDTEFQLQHFLSQIAAELECEGDERIIAYRGYNRWMLDYTPFPLGEVSAFNASLRKNGVYLLTGGLGGLGLALARYLAETVQARLILLGRTGLPDRSRWDEWTANVPPDEHTTECITAVRAMEQAGAEVLVFAADVTDVAAMRSVVEKAYQQFGAIHGVFHAAGIPGAGLIQWKKPEEAKAVLDPKIKGCLVLAEIFQDRAVDFLVLFSSLASLYGGPGQADYCAANCYLDAFAHAEFSRRGMYALSINWCQWQHDSWQEKTVPQLSSRVQETRQHFGLTFEEGIDALLRALSSRQPQVIVSTQQLQTLIRQNARRDGSTLVQELADLYIGEKSEKELEALNAGCADETGKANDIQGFLTKCWRDLFGIATIDIHDDFFELGGHSLLAVQLLSRIRQELQVDLSLHHLFNAPTISDLTALIFRLQLESLEEEELEDLLLEIENLTE